MNILVTGATGWVGGAVVEALLAQGFNVLALSRKAGLHALQHPRLEWLSLAGMAEFAQTRSNYTVGAVVHCAGHAHADGMGLTLQEELVLYRQANVDLTQRVLNFAWELNCKHVVFLSSIKVYGESTPAQGLPWTTPCQPSTAYGISKLEAEQLITHHVQTKGGSADLLRLSMVYDWGLDGLPTKGNLRKLAVGIQQGWLPPLPSNGNARAVVHAGDVVQAISMCIQAVEVAEPGSVRVQVLAEPPVSTSQLCDALRLRQGKALAWLRAPAALLWAFAAVGSGVNACARLLGVRPPSPVHLNMMHKLLGSQYIRPAEPIRTRLEG